MSRHLLVIDRDDKGNFFLSLEGTSLFGGIDPSQVAFVLRDLQVERLHCEVEIAGDHVVLEEEPGSLRRDLNPGQLLHFGPATVRLVAAPAAAGEPAPASPAAPPKAAAAPPTSANLVRRLAVVDGADKGRTFGFNSSGITSIGKSHGSADICLNDLYVARRHCELQVEGDQVFVTHREGKDGTLINGKRISERHELRTGDVLRVGNSHLRLELGVAETPAATEKSAPAEAGAAAADATLDQLLRLEDQVLGHFKIGPLLGRGQAGLVFRAEDVKSQHPIALKVLSPEFPKSDAEMQTFIKALKVVPQLKNTFLVTLHGAGKTGAYCWIAREYVEGESLARLIARLTSDGKLGWKRACRVAVHMAKALAFLHQHKVVHGNITPWNILIDSDTKIAKLADVMLEQALQGSQLRKAGRDRKLLAELPYHAPEQLATPPSCDDRSDLSALGSVLYCLLTGHPAFPGSTATEVLTQMRDSKIARPTKVHKDMPGALEAAVLKLLAYRPQDRLQSAAKLLEVVEPIVTMHDIKL